MLPPPSYRVVVGDFLPAVAVPYVPRGTAHENLQICMKTKVLRILVGEVLQGTVVRCGRLQPQVLVYWY